DPVVHAHRLLAPDGEQVAFRGDGPPFRQHALDRVHGLLRDGDRRRVLGPRGAARQKRGGDQTVPHVTSGSGVERYPRGAVGASHFTARSIVSATQNGAAAVFPGEMRSIAVTAT